MGVLSWIAIGLLAGWLAARLTDSPSGLIRNLVVGLVGALLGGFLASKLGIAVVRDFWGELITAIGGAVIFLLIWRAIRQA
ncbi:MAG: GlsB/YeaQ/YmgE family stress response membrane protein [Alphaproteobacteria bacterium]|nr:GlsB/YeaQ/YmgE family stress response membrane protein [Alphaproteobacteria bacterium]